MASERPRWIGIPVGLGRVRLLGRLAPMIDTAAKTEDVIAGLQSAIAEKTAELASVEADVEQAAITLTEARSRRDTLRGEVRRIERALNALTVTISRKRKPKPQDGGPQE